MNLKQKLINDVRYKEALTGVLQNPSVLIALTGMCNFNCSYCSTKKNKKIIRNIELNLLEKILSDCKKWNIHPSFGQTYEPFLHPKIEQIINLVNDYGFRFISNTNGSCISEKVYNLPMNLTISISENRKDYSYRGSGIDFGKYKEKIKSFIRYRVNNDISGKIQFQIADYSIFEKEDIAYDKTINSVDVIKEKIIKFCDFLGLEFNYDNENLLHFIKTRKEMAVYSKNECRISFITTKIMPNSFDAFLDTDLMNEAQHGYCDSCFCMMSIQADGGIAYCCCDPSANTVFHHMKADECLQEIWHGKKIKEIREKFIQRKPVNDFCRKCLYSVSENIKPLLTYRNKSVVSKILNDKGITENLPWFEFD